MRAAQALKKYEEDIRMRYEIQGETLPVVICYLENGEMMITERGSMSWMSPNMKMETTQTEELEKRWEECLQGKQFSRTGILQWEETG